MKNIDAIIRFCAEECERQRSGELSVYHMWQAYQYATLHDGEWKGGAELHLFIRMLGEMVEPKVNECGFRRQQVIIRGANRQPPDHSVVWGAVSRLCEHTDTISPAEFYKAFEEIHPFTDGNGRVGAILFNYMSGTLEQPVFPPNFWHKEKWDQEG
jgi:Fic family protein